jgi:phytoene desaturase
MKSVAVIGAGPGGLTAGMLLASKGYQVTVYEKQPFIGGRTSAFHQDGYTFDRGPTFLNMPHILEEMFQLADRRLEDYIELKRLEPMYQLKFKDATIDSTTDQSVMYQNIEAVFPGNGEGYRRFMKKEKEKFEALMPILQNKHDSLLDYLQLKFIKALPKLTVTDSLHDQLSKYFSDERLRLAFTFQAKYLGMSPWECPGAFTILSYMEHAYGVYHPVGGVNKITEAMVKVIKEYGGEVVTSSGVKELIIEKGRVKGLQLDSGEKVFADEVVINADFAHAMEKLMPEGSTKKYTSDKLMKKSYSCSAFMLYVGVDKKYDLPHHTIVFSEDYRKNVEEITKKKILSQDPSIYIHNPSVTDPTLAPEGKSALYILAPVPNNFSLIDWEHHKHDFKKLVLEQLQERTDFKDLEQHIETEYMFTPLDWENKLSVYKGATFNLGHQLTQMMYFRPHNKQKEIEGLWLVGGGTHPGSGLPTIMESARITTTMMAEKHDAMEVRSV